MIRDARPDDVPEIIAMIRELADYEKALEEAQATPEQLKNALFCEHPACFANMAEDETGSVVGYAIWFLSYSTWQGVHGIYLEDLYVRPSARKKGFGKALLCELARICVARGYGRFEWSVLDWNQPSIDFYESLGAREIAGWNKMRLSGDALKTLGSGT